MLGTRVLGRMILGGTMLEKKRIIPRDEFVVNVDGMECHATTRNNWLFASEFHEITEEDLKALKNGDCLALNIDNEFVCFIMLKEVANED